MTDKKEQPGEYTIRKSDKDRLYEIANTMKYFILNGVELGFIRMPETIADPATKMPSLVNEAMTIIESLKHNEQPSDDERARALGWINAVENHYCNEDVARIIRAALTPPKHGYLADINTVEDFIIAIVASRGYGQGALDAACRIQQAHAAEKPVDDAAVREAVEHCQRRIAEVPPNTLQRVTLKIDYVQDLIKAATAKNCGVVEVTVEEFCTFINMKSTYFPKKLIKKIPEVFPNGLRIVADKARSGGGK